MPPILVMTEHSKYYYEYDRNDLERPNPFNDGPEYGYEYTPPVDRNESTKLATPLQEGEETKT